MEESDTQMEKLEQARKYPDIIEFYSQVSNKLDEYYNQMKQLNAQLSEISFNNAGIVAETTALMVEHNQKVRILIDEILKEFNNGTEKSVEQPNNTE